MAGRVIAILEDNAQRTAAMRQVLAHDLSQYEHLFFDNAPDMIAWLQEHLDEVALISLDHDLGANRQRDGEAFDPGTGRDVADFLASHRSGCKLLIHSNNYPAVLGMRRVLEDRGLKCLCVTPYGGLEWIERVWAARVRKVLSAADQ